MNQYVKPLQQRGVSCPTSCWALFCSFPKLLLRRVTIHGTYFKKTICWGDKMCFSMKWITIQGFRLTSEFLGWIGQITSFWVHHTPVIHQTDQKKPVLLRIDFRHQNEKNRLTPECWGRQTRCLLRIKRRCLRDGGKFQIPTVPPFLPSLVNWHKDWRK